jgi:CheY-like chemotaxis protein
MTTKMKVVCPKCKAKLKFDPEKIKSDVVKFKCPGCAAVLSIRKPRPQKEVLSSQSASQPESNVGKKMEHPGTEFLDLASKFGEDMASAGDDRADESKDVDNEAERKAVKEDHSSEMKEGDEEVVEKSATAGEKGKNSRGFKRVKFKKKVLVNKQIMVEVLDISENGLFLHTGRSFEDGAIVEVGIPTRPGNFDLTVKAVVKHNHRGIGMGMQFVELDDKQKMQLNKLISELDEVALKELEGRRKILLAGGTDTARNINKSKLVLDGFYVMQAKTADEVFNLLNNEAPDAIVLEWQETAFSCKGVIARIKENPRYGAIIRVVLSALTDSSVQREILDAGAHRCMAKMDTNPAKLSQVLKQLIEERESAD